MTRRQKRTLYRIIAATVLLIAARCLPLEGVSRLAAYLVPYIVIGFPVLRSAVRNIAHGQIFDEQFLMAVATLGALAVGEYPEASAVMIFYEIGELFQGIAVGRSRRSIAQLMDIRPDTATVLRGGEECTVSPEEVSVGETIVIRPGERIPLDGVILDGATSVDTAALTGESLPQDKAAGDRVVSGTVNLTGVIYVRTQSVFGDSTVTKILEMVENATSKKAKVESFITRFAHWYTPCVVGGAVLLALIPPIFFHGEWSDWIHRALIFLVVSCPCALVVSVPLSFFGGIGGASRIGVLIKGANDLETLSKLDTVVFDKTGTLTQGKFAVQAVHAKCGLSEESLLRIASAVESHSTHPIAAAIREAAPDGASLPAEHIREIAGAGLEADMLGETVYAGNERMMARAGVQPEVPGEIGTVVHLAKTGKRGPEYLGFIVAADVCKPGAADAIAELKGLGVSRTIMLTGDRRPAAEAVGRRLGLDEIHAELLPGDKVSKVEGLLGSGHTVGFVGDGINDAPVLARADVGIAMGAMGSDAAIESADVVLMDDRLGSLPRAVRLARKTMRIVRENIIFALAVKAVILVLSAFGQANMWIAVFGDVGVLVLAILNAMRAMQKIE